MGRIREEAVEALGSDVQHSSVGERGCKRQFCLRFSWFSILNWGKNGKQYVAVVAAANGQGNDESLHVFALP